MNLLKNLFKDEKTIIQEIHDSFDNAQENLLKQAMFIIDKHDPNISNKAERLEKLGFTSSKVVIDNLNKKQELISSKEDADLVNYYKKTYPFLKFLKEEQLDEICKKYNLVYAPVARYKEDVPEKNVNEIENCQPLKQGDVAKNRYFCKITETHLDAPRELAKILKKGFYTDRYIDWDHDVLRDVKRLGLYNGNYEGWVISAYGSVLSVEEDMQGLFIAAPKSHFDLKGLKNKGLGFFNITITEVKDPIVFRYVRGGIQVLSKWGLEAEDEMLQQEILN